ncbi:MAG TPA: hypothetical protein P5080_03250 [Candidatus Paceibacterota bacterium]|nr:hypothetical protein [Candidatus Pacearchaeota archaeon]HRZ50984.1 hypothetical protein [Candidatus Paceibacterota bacterium]HSA36705.1 hypothetical protein [Candidatus Paceibacterota bacterium]
MDDRALNLLRLYVESCDRMTKKLMNILFAGMVLFGIFLMVKNPNALLGGSILYIVFAGSLVFVKSFFDGKIVEYYRSRYDSDWQTHVRLNRGGWIKDANKAFRVNKREMIAALISNLLIKARTYLWNK